MTPHFTVLLSDLSGFLSENRAVVMPIKMIGRYILPAGDIPPRSQYTKLPREAD